MIKNFAELLSRLKEMPSKKKVALAPAQDEHALQAIIKASEDGLVEPILIGDTEKIGALLKELGKDQKQYNIIDKKEPEVAVQAAVDLARKGQADAIMKGKTETGSFMKVVVNKEKGISTGAIMSILAFMESPYYHKLFALTDVGLLMYPNKEQKIAAIQNAVDAFHVLGVEEPKVAIITAIEKVNPKMPETVEAAEIKKQGIAGCIIEGPISYDLAMSKEACQIKGYTSPVAGDADILVMKDIVCGNVAAKTMITVGGAETGGVVLGAKVPIILVSRAANAMDKYLAIVMAALTSKSADKN